MRTPNLKETAGAFRARGGEVCARIPDAAVWATQHWHSMQYPTPRWLVFTAGPLPFPAGNLFYLGYGSERKSPETGESARTFRARGGSVSAEVPDDASWGTECEEERFPSPRWLWFVRVGGVDPWVQVFDLEHRYDR